MSRLNANIGEAYYSVKKWLGVNENPDGDTNLRDGEGAVMRNFRITDGGALRKRPGSAVVAGLLGAYSASVGSEQYQATEYYTTARSLTAYPGIKLNSAGQIELTGTPVTINYANNVDYIGYYFKDANGKVWQHSRASMALSSALTDADIEVEGGYIRESSTGNAARISYEQHYNTTIRVWDSVKINTTSPVSIVGVGDYTDINFYTDNKANTAAGAHSLTKENIGKFFIPLDGMNVSFTTPAKITGADWDYSGDPTLIYSTYRISAYAVYQWYAKAVTATANASTDTSIRGLWSGSVNGTEYIVAACNGHLWSLTETDGVWAKTDIGVIDTSDRVCIFGFGGNLYCLDSTDYHKWDGTVFTSVTGYIPLVATASTPKTGGGTTIDRVNLLTPRRRQRYNATGEDTVYYLLENNLASIDYVEVAGAAVSNYTVNLTSGTVTFTTAPAEGAENVEIWYTVKESYRSKVTAMRFAELYNGVTDSRVFLYGDGSNVCIYSDVTEAGAASAEYFPDLNEIAIGDSNSPITGMIRQYSRLMAFKKGGSAWSIYYDTITLADGQVTAGFYCAPVNRDIGNDAMGQACLVENLPRTVDGRSIYMWKSSSGGYITNDQRNAQRVSQKVENTLHGFDLANSLMFYDKIAHEFYCVYNGTAVVQNTENEAWYVYTNFPAVALIVHKDELYYGTAEGNLCRFSDDYTSDNGEPIDAYWESGSLSFERDYVLKYSPTVWAGLKQEENAAVEIGIETDVQEPIYGAITVEGGAEAMPSMKRMRLKAQKFTYYKLLLRSCTADTRATVVATDVRVLYNIKVK